MTANSQIPGLFGSTVEFSDIAGADEAGAGALAGPVSAAAVILGEDYDWSFLKDSKLLSPERRMTYASLIEMHAVSFAVCLVPHTVVDRINILNARLQAIRTALRALSPSPRLALIDGNRIPAGLPFETRSVVAGDRLVQQISAASILAKVKRDLFMQRISCEFSAYGFDVHFGYATAQHLHALSRSGCCKIHRKTYAPVRSSLREPNDEKTDRFAF